MKKLSQFFLLPLTGLAALYLLGPREAVKNDIKFDPRVIGDDLDDYLRVSEAEYPTIIPGAEKEIIWADSSKSETEFSIVYLHGFSASKEEIRPVPDIVAKELHANLFYNRFRGHGRDGDALGKVSANDWINDALEAIEIGRRIGDKVIVVSTSTGSTIASWVAGRPELMQDVVGMIMVAPNYGLKAAGSTLLTFPWARKFVPTLAGKSRSFEPLNEGNAKWWTTKYPTVAVLPMASLIEEVIDTDFSSVSQPALFIYSEKDDIVIPENTAEIARNWGGPSTTVHLDSIEDPNNHVIAGDIMSPSNTQKASLIMLDWIRKL